MLKKIICNLFLLCVSVLFSQEPIHYFIGKDFFNGTELYSIVQDTDNSMWISSNKGVYHYNGINFTKVSNEVSKQDAFFGLTKDNNNTIYCFNFTGQIFRIEDNSLKLFYTLSSDKIGNNLYISFDNLNNLIIGSGSNLTKVSATTKEVTTYKGRGLSIQKKKDTLFYGKDFLNGKSAIVSRFNDKETVYQNLSSKLGQDVAIYTNLHFCGNKLYAFSSRDNKLYLVENDSIKNLPLGLPPKNYYGSYFSNGRFWFINNKNGIFNKKLKDIDLNVNFKKWFKDYRISGVYTDFENNTWLLTFDDGIIIIPNLNVSNFKIKEEKLTAIKKINHNIYVSTNNNKIYSFKKDAFKPFLETESDRFESFSIFKNKNIVTSSTSVYKNGKRQKERIVFNRGTVLVNDTIYVALHVGLHKYNIKTNKLVKIDSRRTYDIKLSAKKDKIYVSSVSGLLLYDFNNVVKMKYRGKNVLSKKLTCVKDEMWASSKNGIYIAKGNKIIKNITKKDGLLSNNIEKIKYEHPYVYITSRKGFQQYHIENKTFNNLVEDHGLTKSIKNFEVLNDTIYALTTNGLAVFSFNDVKPKVAKYKTNITEAIANGTKTFKNNVSLEPDENNVSFSFLTTSHRYQKKLDYSYQLIGYDKQPIIAKNGQYIVNYSNLPAGNYTFKVQSAIHNNQNYPATIQFSIQQYWYKTNGFKIAIISLIILMFYSIYINRIKALKRKRKQEQFEKAVAESSLTSLKAQMNPHFLFNAMNSVQSLILKEKKDDAYSYLTKLSRLIRETLNMSDKTWVYLDEEIEQITNYLELEKLRFSNDFSYQINIDETLYALKIPSMIIQPFVENAIKHGLLHKDNEKYIAISFKMEKDLLECTVEDNGIGREASREINSLKPNYQESFSTNAIQKRFKLYQEYLKVNAGFEFKDLFNEQNKAVGTRVTINIPYQKDEN